VQQLVTRMQGSVDVRSEPGVGSRFTVRLPACASGSAQAGRTEASALRA